MIANRRIVEDSSHKAVIVLDRSPNLTAAASAIILNLKDERGVPVHTTLSKNLWNCSIEAVLEFHRVVSDLFPHGTKQLRFVISDFVGRFLTNSWTEDIITYEELLSIFSNCDPPQEAADASSCSILNGISMGIEALSERTPLQKDCLVAYGAHSDALRKMLYEKNDGIEAQNNHYPSSSTTNAKWGESWRTSETDGAAESLNKQPTQENGSRRPRRINVADVISKRAATSSIPNNTSPSTADAGEIAEERADEAAAFASNSAGLTNRGTMIVLTSIKSEKEYDDINEHVLEQIKDRNSCIKTMDSQNFVQIDRLNLFVLNLVPSANKGASLNGKLNSQFLNSRLISTLCGRQLTTVIHSVLLKIYDLMCTTVAGIPMKEETPSTPTNADSSITAQQLRKNYDVDLFHPKSAHDSLSSNGLISCTSADVSDKKSANNSKIEEPGPPFNKIKLNWISSTPKLKSDMFPILQNTYPVTPAFVNERQTICLTTFILAGKTVMLEVPVEAYQTDPQSKNSAMDGKRLGPNLVHAQKLISHLLVKDIISGMISIHSVAIGEQASLGGLLRSDATYETEFDPAALNYLSMSQMMNSALLTPVPIKSQEGFLQNAFNPSAKQYFDEQKHIEKLCQYLPLTMHDTFIFSIPERIGELLSVVQKRHIPEEEVDKFKSFVGNMVFNFTSSGTDPLTLKPQDKCRLFANKNPSKEQQYRVTFEELYKVIQNFAHISGQHREMLTHFSEATGVRLPSMPNSSDTEAHDGAENLQRGVKRSTLSSQVSMHPSKKLKTGHLIGLSREKRQTYGPPWLPGEKIRLVDLLDAEYNKKYMTNWKDFEGRKKYGDQAQNFLYPGHKSQSRTIANE